MLDETLCWNEQVNAITTKVNRGLNVLKRLREFVHLETLLIAYKTLVQPYFDYCSQVWGGIGSTLSDKLQRLQNRAARTITKCGSGRRERGRGNGNTSSVPIRDAGFAGGKTF